MELQHVSMNHTQRDHLAQLLGHLRDVHQSSNISQDNDDSNVYDKGVGRLHPGSGGNNGSGSLFPSLPDTGEMGDDELEWQLLLTIHEPSTIALTVLYTLSFALGIVGNVLSIKVLCGRRGNSERLSGTGGVSSTRVLLVNLAVCDLAVVCVCMPVTLGNRIYMAWVWGGFLCRAVPFTQAVAVAASVLSVTVISVNRYVSVRCPLRARTLFTRRRVLAAVAVVWLASAGICAPLAVMTRLDELRLPGLAAPLPVCSEAWPHARLRQAYNVLLFSALYCLPVCFNLAVGCLTGRRLCGYDRDDPFFIPEASSSSTASAVAATAPCSSSSFKKTTGVLSLGNGGGGSGRFRFSELDPRTRTLHAARLRGRRQIARLVLALVLLFAASWLPLYLADLWLDYGVGMGWGGSGDGDGENMEGGAGGDGDGTSRGGAGGGGGESNGHHQPPDWLLQARPFAQWLGLTNSSLNPICYCLVGDLSRSARQLRMRYQQRILTFFRGGQKEGGTQGNGGRKRGRSHTEEVNRRGRHADSDLIIDTTTTINTTAASSEKQPPWASTLALASLPKILSLRREDRRCQSAQDGQHQMGVKTQSPPKPERDFGKNEGDAAKVDSLLGSGVIQREPKGHSECITLSTVC